MKKLALIMTLFIGSVTAVQAQDKAAKDVASPYAATANTETEKLNKIVQLTPQQKEQIYRINLSLAERTSIIEKSDNPDKSSLTSEVENYRRDMYMQTLNPEQAAAYKKSLTSK